MKWHRILSGVILGATMIVATGMWLASGSFVTGALVFLGGAIPAGYIHGD